jgi:hypothetical protein
LATATRMGVNDPALGAWAAELPGVPGASGLPLSFLWKHQHADQSTTGGADERGLEYRLRVVAQGNQRDPLTGFGATFLGIPAIVITGT